MAVISENIEYCFCSSHSCGACPFSMNFHPDKFSKDMEIRSCIKACEEEARERVLTWLVENDGDTNSLNDGLRITNICIEDICVWCGYNLVEFI